MSFVATAIVGGSVIAGGLGLAGSIYASNQQTGEEQAALAQQQAAQAKLSPYENIGAGATYSLGQLYGIGQNGKPTGQAPNFSQFTQSPDYQFALQQGQQSLQSQLNASGLAGSGAGEAAALQFGQGLASQQYSNYFNRLLSLSQIGQQAAGTGVAGSNASAQTLGAIGQSQASGIIGGVNALTGGINSGISNSLLYNALNRNGNPSSFAPDLGYAQYSNGAPVGIQGVAPFAPPG